MILPGTTPRTKTSTILPPAQNLPRPNVFRKFPAPLLLRPRRLKLHPAERTHSCPASHNTRHWIMRRMMRTIGMATSTRMPVWITSLTNPLPNPPQPPVTPPLAPLERSKNSCPQYPLPPPKHPAKPMSQPHHQQWEKRPKMDPNTILWPIQWGPWEPWEMMGTRTLDMVNTTRNLSAQLPLALPWGAYCTITTSSRTAQLSPILPIRLNPLALVINQHINTICHLSSKPMVYKTRVRYTIRLQLEFHTTLVHLSTPTTIVHKVWTLTLRPVLMHRLIRICRTINQDKLIRTRVRTNNSIQSRLQATISTDIIQWSTVMCNIHPLERMRTEIIIIRVNTRKKPTRIRLQNHRK
uniref:Uncharacterized protein n=1 Tax=Cacopsylla melanoneura TaxID=428564 RepID=A0A8D8YV08_9HEMI